METLPQEVQQAATLLFKQKKTIQEISELTGYDQKEILLYLTKIGCWSQYCSTCVIKRCYDCKGLEELGKPVSVQDQIDFIARSKNGKINGNKT